MAPKNNDLNFKKIKDQQENYLLLKKWLNQPEVLEWYEGQPYDWEMTIKKFQPKILNQTSSHPFFILLNQQKIGYIQFYEVNDNQDFFPFPPNEVVVGIDLFIADEVHQNRGLGTKVIQSFCHFLQKNYQVTTMIVDPQVKNQRAIRVFEKCGFKKQKLLRAHEVFKNKAVDCWLMVKN